MASGSEPEAASTTGAGDGRVERFTSAEGLPDNLMRDLCLARDGTLWLATRVGLVRLRLDRTLRPAAVKTFTYADGLASNDVKVLHPAGDGRLWVGTASGVSAIDGESVSSYGESARHPRGGLLARGGRQR